MKKSTLPILTLIMAMSLAACGNKDEGEAAVLETPAPVLTEEVNMVVAEEVGGVSVIELTGTVNIERMSEAPSVDEDPSIIIARAGMRLMNRDTLRTFAESAAWLLLEEDRAVELGELTALHIDKQDKGFVLTLSEGEVKAQIDRPLSDGEEFTVVAGDLVLAVRGTVFSVVLEDLGTVATVSVERGEVAVMDAEGEEIATVKAGESQSFKTGKLVAFGGYEWRVLEVRDGKALLLSEYVLELRSYDVGMEDMTWETCTLRSYLNGEFYNSFNEGDRARISQTRNSNKDNQGYGTSGGNDTDDYIFLLSLEEVMKYFGDSRQLANRPNESSWWKIDDEYNEARVAYGSSSGGRSVGWWLRSPGYYGDDAAYGYGPVYVGSDGCILVFLETGSHGGSSSGVRPALWLNL